MPHSRPGKLERIAFLSAVSLLALGSFALPVLAQKAPANAAVDSDEKVLKGILPLESRFFFHKYEQDPLEKRLQRLELLIFGGTQAGSNDERLARLLATIQERDKQAAKDIQSENAKAKTAPGAGKAPATAGGASYPVLATLEWRALQKTYSQEPLDQRLGRLETKLFGQPSPAMSYADRVDRLKRTLGIETADASPTPSSPFTGKIGPKPRAMPRTPGMTPFDYFSRDNGILPNPGMGIGPGMGIDDDMFTMPNMPGAPPEFMEMQKQMHQAMQQLNRQLRQMHPSPSPSPQIIPGDPNFIQIKPLVPHQEEKPKIPPYYDPNSI